MQGIYKSILITKHIFSFTRKLEGHIGYFIIMNVSKKDLTLNFHVYSDIPLIANLVYFFGSNSNETNELRKTYKINQTIQTNKIHLKNKSCFILSL